MKKLLDPIKTHQNRIATGNWQDATTRLYVIDYGEGIRITDDIADWDEAGYCKGYVDVIHSSIMAGTWTDILWSWRNIIIDRLIDLGLAKESIYQTNFVG